MHCCLSFRAISKRIKKRQSNQSNQSTTYNLTTEHFSIKLWQSDGSDDKEPNAPWRIFTAAWRVTAWRIMAAAAEKMIRFRSFPLDLLWKNRLTNTGILWPGASWCFASSASVPQIQRTTIPGDYSCFSFRTWGFEATSLYQGQLSNSLSLSLSTLLFISFFTFFSILFSLLFSISFSIFYILLLSLQPASCSWGTTGLKLGKFSEHRFNFNNWRFCLGTRIGTRLPPLQCPSWILNRLLIRRNSWEGGTIG